MVEEHVGKKRRKEVRQAIVMRDEMRSLLRSTLIMLAIAVVLVAILYALSTVGITDISNIIVQTLPIVVAVIALVISTPKASKYWAVREKYKDHLLRYNITKDDMQALENQEL